MSYIEKLPFELLGPAGTEFSYSNEAFGLLGAIVERVSGKTYEAYVQEHILQPLGMERTVFHVEELGENDNTTMLYTRRMNDGVCEAVRAPGWWDAPSMRAAGFLKSSARDMLRYADVYRTGGLSNGARIISGDSASQMTTPHTRIDLSRSYGYGLGVFPFSEEYTLLTHTGGLKGMTAQMFIIPEAGVTGILLTNMDDAPIANLTLGLLNSMFGRPLETQFATFSECEVPLAYLQQCPGTYKSGEGEAVEIRFDEAQRQLVLVLGSDEFPLRSVGEDTFLFTRHNVDSLIRFVRHPDGEIKRLALGSRQMPKAI